MCAVSAILDYGRRTPVEDYTTDWYQDYLRLLEQAKKFDDAQKQPDCEDPSKLEFLKQIVERLVRIEKKLELNDEMDRLKKLFSKTHSDPFFGSKTASSEGTPL